MRAGKTVVYIGLAFGLGATAVLAAPLDGPQPTEKPAVQAENAQDDQAHGATGDSAAQMTPEEAPADSKPSEAMPVPPSVFSREIVVSEAVKKDVAGSVQRGKELVRLGAIERGVLLLREATAIDPNNKAAFESLRRAAIDLGETEFLAEVLASLTRISKENGFVGLAHERLNELQTVSPGHPQVAVLGKLLGRDKPQKKTETSILTRLRSIFGVFFILLIAFAMSNNRRKINWRLVGWGLGLQLVFAVIILWTTPGQWVFTWAKGIVEKILSFTDHGAGFLFGNIYNGMAPLGGSGPVQYVDGTSGDYKDLGLIFAFHVLPTIIFFGSLMSVLYHLNIVQLIVKGVAWVMTRTMGTSGAESLSAAGNIFVGQTEAPLLIKPYLEKMTNSELTTIMTGGFATAAGGVLAAYVRFGIDAGHLLAASVMSAPAAVVISKIMVPEIERPVTMGGNVEDPKKLSTNVVDAAASGAADGLKLALNVGAMLMAFIALVALIDWVISPSGLSLKEIFGLLFTPLSWAMGVDIQDLGNFGNLLGTKLAVNEFVAYVDLGGLRGEMTERSFVIGTYALCGFANFSSIGIQIGGISSIAPSRRADLAKFAVRAMFGGALASWLTATIAGALL
jgi:CNT family concentrative nucleoside transporter